MKFFTKLSLIAVLVLSIFTGCSNGGGDDQGTSSENEGNKESEVITLTLWDYYEPDAAHGKAQIELIKKYEEENPNVKIKRTYVPNADLKTKLMQGIAGNELPDIVVIDNPDHQAFAAAGAFADITKEIEEWGEADQYYEGAWNSTIYEGKNYGVPNNSNALALFYNKDMFEEAGITEPPKTCVFSIYPEGVGGSCAYRRV